MGKFDLAYFAGFFDGEGCISIATQRSEWKDKPIKNYRLECVVGSTNHWIIELMKFQFGGAVYCDRRDNHPVSHRPFWRWMICSKQALAFLREVYPYLRLKKPEADIAIKWQEKRKRGQRQTDEIRAVNEAQKILLQNLKRQEVK